MRYSVVAAATLIAACNQTPAVDPNVKAVLDAGTAAISKMQQCIDHMKSAGNAATPSCNASAEFKAYQDARIKVTTPGIPALQAMDERFNAIRLEATSVATSLAFKKP